MPAIIVHGGAAPIEPEEADAKREGCRRAAQAGWAVLHEGGSALDAVEASVRILEADPNFNAALGSMLNADGVVRTDAGIMEGNSLRSGAVGAAEGLRHPISVARRLLDEAPVLLAGHYARRYAEERGLEVCAPEDLVTDKQRRKWEEQNGKDNMLDKNTVGAVAVDVNGCMAAGASTGGTGNNMPGRVGDSASAGGGFYADDAAGAVSLTGDGENILRVVLARTAVELMGVGLAPDEAAQKAVARMQARVGGEVGCILIDRKGRVGWGHNAENMAVAYITDGMDAPRAYIHKDEEAGGKAG